MAPEWNRLRIVLLFALALAVCSSPARGEMQRRMNVGLDVDYYFLDSNFFGMDDGFGAGFVFRYEVSNDVYLENFFGRFASNDGLVDIDGLNYHLDLLAVFPVLIPYRPLLRAGAGFLAVNPITATPTQTYRPAQTAFYLIAGGGFTRSFRENIFAEVSADLYVTPYEYRIYEFDRSSVTTEDARFTHLVLNVGLSYSF